MDIKTQRIVNLGLSAITCAGVIGTFIFAIKETPKAQEELSKLPKDAKKITKTKVFIKNYKKSLIFASATILSAITSKIMSTKMQASLIGAATLVDTSFRKYKNKVKETLGIDVDKNIVEAVAKDEFGEPDTSNSHEDEVLYLEPHIGYFYAKPKNVWAAFEAMNEDISNNNNYYISGREFLGYITLGDFLTLCEGRPLSRNISQEKLNIGWSVDYLHYWHPAHWIHKDIGEPDKDGARLIYWYEEPIWNPEMWEKYVDGDITPEEYWNGLPINSNINKNDQVYTLKTKKEKQK